MANAISRSPWMCSTASLGNEGRKRVDQERKRIAAEASDKACANRDGQRSEPDIWIARGALMPRDKPIDVPYSS